jgi:hypothetical protein
LRFPDFETTLSDRKAATGRVRHAQELFMALRHFLDQHPEARAGMES